MATLEEKQDGERYLGLFDQRVRQDQLSFLPDLANGLQHHASSGETVRFACRHWSPVVASRVERETFSADGLIAERAE
ncbi:MAG: hypothetical protein M1815_003130 [Lichina confinis]|nr:MAG: hypothetical protein M1815_003130 [Lichina confinis]